MTDQSRIFLYGTLLDPGLYGIVGGAPLEGVDATLPGHRVHWARGESFPVLIEDAEARAAGLVVTVPDVVKARLDFYEMGFGYDLLPRVVETVDGPVGALVYFPEAGRWPEGAVWSLIDWQRDFGERTRSAASDYMRLCGTRPASEAAWSFPQIVARAASRMRAGAAPSPLMPGVGAMPAPEIVTTRYPYTQYFGLREDDLSVPTFAGGQGPVVTRASWLGADAVTVLPYDPATGRVLMVRQFRHGAFARGDTNPYCIEPVAGRIDPGEGPEEAARREMLEEAGVATDRLIRVAGYYPTPGAFSEHLTSYVALADLSGRDGTLGGVEDEAEDIMSHVVPLDAALEMIETGVVNTGPLVLSLLWLDAHKDRLYARD